MHITLSLNVQAHEGTLMLTDRAGKTVTFSKEQTVQQKVSMITLGEFCGLPKRQLATCFGFKTRKSYYDIRHPVLNGPPADLLPSRRGSSPKKRLTSSMGPASRAHVSSPATTSRMMSLLCSPAG